MTAKCAFRPQGLHPVGLSPSTCPLCYVAGVVTGYTVGFPKNFFSLGGGAASSNS